MCPIKRLISSNRKLRYGWSSVHLHDRHNNDDDLWSYKRKTVSPVTFLLFAII